MKTSNHGDLTAYESCGRIVAIVERVRGTSYRHPEYRWFVVGDNCKSIRKADFDWEVDNFSTLNRRSFGFYNTGHCDNGSLKDWKKVLSKLEEREAKVYEDYKRRCWMPVTILCKLVLGCLLLVEKDDAKPLP